jgi:co-chaperonin GroES (HSP10)
VLRPLHRRVLVQRVEKPVGLIVIRQERAAVDGAGGDYRRRMLLGTVIATGPQCDPEVAVGATIVFSCWDDADGQLPEGLQMIREQDIAGIVE